MDRQYQDRQDRRDSRDQDQDQSQSGYGQDQDVYDDQEDQGMQAARQNIGRQGGDPARGSYRQGQQGRDAYTQDPDEDQPRGGYQDQSQSGYRQRQSQADWDTEDDSGYDDQGQSY